MADQFPIVIRGYDKEQVDRAFASAQQTLAALRAQIKQDGDRLLQLQAKLQEERNRQSSKNHTFASLGANAQQMLASTEQTSTELLERAKQDAASTRASAKAQAEEFLSRAAATEQLIDEQFMEDHLPISLDYDSEPLWAQYDRYGAKQLLRDCFGNTLLKGVGLA